MEIIGWNKSKKMVYIGECDCGAIIKAKRSDIKSIWSDGAERFDYYGRCPDCADDVSFREVNEEEWENKQHGNHR